MNFLTVDENRCHCDTNGLCVEDCPMGILRLSPQHGLPELKGNTADYCIRCGHCVAVCPSGALSLATVPLDNCLPAESADLPGSEQVSQLLRSRRAVRQYQNKPVPLEVLERLIDITRWTPSAKNIHPLQWLVIDSAEGMEQIRRMVIDCMSQLLENKDNQRLEKLFRPIINAARTGTDYIFWRAPALLVVHAKRKIPTAPADATVALTSCEILARTFGLGSCWAGYFQMAANTYQPLRNALNLPKEDDVLGGVMIGYPAVSYQRIPPRPPARVRWHTVEP